MRGLAEHLGLLILQQRGAATALESELLSLVQEVRALQSATRDYAGPAVAKLAGEEPLGGFQQKGDTISNSWQGSLPPQLPLRLALEAQRQGLLRALEALRGVQLLVRALEQADPPSSSSTSSTVSENGWGQSPSDASSSSLLKKAVIDLEGSVLGMLRRLEQYPTCPKSAGSGGSVGTVPLLGPVALQVILDNQDALLVCSHESQYFAKTFASVVPPSMLAKVGRHFSQVRQTVDTELDSNAVMSRWLHPHVGNQQLLTSTEGRGCSSGESSSRSGDGPGIGSQQISSTSCHTSKVSNLLSQATKTMLLSVQALCPRLDNLKTPTSRHSVDTSSGFRNNEGCSVEGGGEEELQSEGWSTGTTLYEAHASAFEQARGLKLWRCADALALTRTALKDFTEDELVDGAEAAEASEALLGLLDEVLGLAEQVLAAGKAVMVGMIALNKVLRCTCFGDCWFYGHFAIFYAQQVLYILVPGFTLPFLHFAW